MTLIPCTCGCRREYPRAEIFDMRVKRPVSKHCHAVRMRWPRISGTVSLRNLPGAIYRVVRL